VVLDNAKKHGLATSQHLFSTMLFFLTTYFQRRSLYSLICYQCYYLLYKVSN